MTVQNSVMIRDKLINWCCTQLAWILDVFDPWRFVMMPSLFTGYILLVQTFLLVYSHNWAKFGQDLSWHF